jgi:predicted TIM-barrel fold metal-dependent hydrolase
MTALQERGVSVIDCMINVDPGGGLQIGHIPKVAFRDDESLEHYPSPGVVEYLFKGAAGERLQKSGDGEYVVGLLDEWGIERAGVIVQFDDAERTMDSLEALGDRWFFNFRVNPHDGMRAVRRLEQVVKAYPNVRGVCISPHALHPTIPPNSKEYYPVYAKCVELDIPVWINVGIPGPRVPGSTQDPIYLDEVCWFFPELKIVMKHGGEPWVDTCVKLMLKWPNLYYATSGFAPKYYPEAILKYANTRGADRILYSGYWPILGYDDIFEQIEKLPLRDHVWPKMFSENARKVFKLA